MKTISYSVIIPAYNEELYLSETLNALQIAMKKIDMLGEVIVVDNHSTDRTSEIARNHDAIVIFEPVNQIARARNSGARAAKGKFLLFLDADTLVSDVLLKNALDNLSSGICCGGGAKVIYDGIHPRIVQFALAFWNLLSEKLHMAAGCFIYCLKLGYDAVGGFSESVYASEEIWFSWKLLFWGKPLHMDFRIIDQPRVITSSRKLKWYSLLELLGMAMIFGIFPHAIHYRSLCRLWYDRPMNLTKKRDEMP